jgi:hypothetical protein
MSKSILNRLPFAHRRTRAQAQTEHSRFFEFANQHMGLLAGVAFIPVASEVIGILPQPVERTAKLTILASLFCLCVFAATFSLRGWLGYFARDKSKWLQVVPFLVAVLALGVSGWLAAWYLDLRSYNADQFLSRLTQPVAANKPMSPEILSQLLQYSPSKLDEPVLLQTSLYLLIHATLVFGLGIVLVTAFTQQVANDIQSLVAERLMPEGPHIFRILQDYAGLIELDQRATRPKPEADNTASANGAAPPATKTDPAHTTTPEQPSMNAPPAGGSKPADTTPADASGLSKVRGTPTTDRTSESTRLARQRLRSMAAEMASVEPEPDSDDISDFAHSRLAGSKTALARVAFGILDPAFSQLRMLSKGRLEVGKSQSLHVQEQLCQSFRESFHAVSFRDMSFWTNREQDQMPIDYFMENYQSIIRYKTKVTRLFVLVDSDFEKPEDLKDVLKKHQDARIGWAVAVYPYLRPELRNDSTDLDFALFDKGEAVSYFRGHMEAQRRFTVRFKTGENLRAITRQQQTYRDLLAHCWAVNAAFKEQCQFLEEVRDLVAKANDGLKGVMQREVLQTGHEFLWEVENPAEISGMVDGLIKFRDDWGKNTGNIRRRWGKEGVAASSPGSMDAQ